MLGATVLEPDFDLTGRETHKLHLSLLRFGSLYPLPLLQQKQLVNKFNESFNSICLPTPAALSYAQLTPIPHRANNLVTPGTWRANDQPTCNHLTLAQGWLFC